jgi:hypothetical protein
MSKALKTIASTPATSISPWPSQKKVEQLANRLDAVVEADKHMLAAEERLQEWPSSPDALRRAKDAVNFYVCSGCRRSVTSGYIQKLERECYPACWWDDDGDVQQPEVAKMVAKLVGSWPTSNIPEPAVFVRALIDDVMALNPSFVMFETACRKLRRDLKFMPSIAEILAEIESQERAWDERSTALFNIEDHYQDLVGLIAKSEVAVAAAEERREQQRKYREAKAAPLVLGDRVRHEHVGTGVITKASEGEWDAWYVLFDNASEEDWIMADCLEKLVEGDAGFEPRSRPALPYKPAVPMPDLGCVDTRIAPAASLVAATPELKSETVKE